ncbi:MAG: PBP1A family penicillin-binding protein [Patescibacteria group bacterium]
MPIPQLKPKIRFDKSWRENWHLKKVKKRKEWWEHLTSRWLPILSILILGGGIVGLAAFAWFSRDLPDPNKLIERSVAQSTKIYARDEKTLLYEIHGDQNRTAINLADIASDAKNATIAVEDKNFYQHKGFSLPRIFKALVIDVIQRKKAQGASTITQQFVKNAILTTEKSWTRKFKEIVLAYQIERKFSKDEILKMYFNEIPYGSSLYGIEAASQSFFGKSAKDLSLAQGALLAAIPQAPTYYSPYGTHTDALVARQKMIIDLMVEQKYITQEQGDEAKKTDILKEIKPKRENILAPHFVMYVKEMLAEKYGDKEIEQGGMKVITTLDYDLQKIAEEEIEKGATKFEKYGATNAALVSLDVKTGEVLAMVGSKDYFNADIDGNVNVTLRPRQPGSSFKPFVYATAFKEGYTPETILFDLNTVFKTDAKDYIPKNYDLAEHGPITMRKALQGSLNIPAVKTLYLAGLNNVLDLAESFGYTTFTDRSRFGLSLVLGGGEVKLIEHTNAYAILAREGEKINYSSILRIEDANGKILEKHTQEKKNRVLDQEIARQMSKVLSDNDSRAYIFGANNYLTLGNRPVAAKTGTTDDYRDAWTLGYTPTLVTGVWVGNNNNDEMKRGADGSVIAAPIWNGFMKRALAGKPVEYFKDFKGIETDKPILNGKLTGETPIKVDSVTGKQIPNSCLADWPASFVAEKTVKAVHNILYYVKKEDPRGDPPSDPLSDPQYANWEAPVQKWATDHGYIETMPDLEICSLRSQENLPQINFSAPINNETVTQSPINFTVQVSGSQAISKVEYYIDKTPVGENSVSPYSLAYDASALANGYHDIDAVVTDAVGNTNQASVSINYLPTTAATSLYFISPKQGAEIPMASFPLTIQASAFDPKGVKQVTFAFQNSGGQETIITTLSNPATTNVSAVWPAVPVGSYKLYMTLENAEGNKTQTDYLTVTVK